MHISYSIIEQNKKTAASLFILHIRIYPASKSQRILPLTRMKQLSAAAFCIRLSASFPGKSIPCLPPLQPPAPPPQTSLSSRGHARNTGIRVRYWRVTIKQKQWLLDSIIRVPGSAKVHPETGPELLLCTYMLII